MSEAEAQPAPKSLLAELLARLPPDARNRDLLGELLESVLQLPHERANRQVLHHPAVDQ